MRGGGGFLGGREKVERYGYLFFNVALFRFPLSYEHVPLSKVFLRKKSRRTSQIKHFKLILKSMKHPKF